MKPAMLADMLAEMEAKGEKVAWVLSKDPRGALAGDPMWGVKFVQDGSLESGVVVLKSSTTTLQFVYWHPPSSLTNGHFWVLKRLVQDGKGLWECSQCGLSAESKKTTGFRVAVPHWSDLEGDSCEQLAVNHVHAL